MSNEQVNHPTNYNQENIEAIDALQAASTEEEFKGFLRLSAMKYLWRLGRKDHVITEAEKVKWYVQKLLDLEYDKSRKVAENTIAEASYPLIQVEELNKEPEFKLHLFPVEPMWNNNAAMCWAGHGWYVEIIEHGINEFEGPFEERIDCQKWIDLSIALDTETHL